MPSRWKRLWMFVILVMLTGLSLLSLDSVLAPSQQVARCTCTWCTCCTCCTYCTWLASRSWVKCAQTLLELLSAMFLVLLGCFGCLRCLSSQTVAKKPRFWLMVATVPVVIPAAASAAFVGPPTGSATSAVGAAQSSPTASTKFQPEGAQGTRRRRRKVVEASPCSGHWFSRWHSLESGGAKYHPRGARVLSRATTEGIQKGTFSTSTSSTIGVQLFFQLFNYGAAGWPWDRSHHWYQHDWRNYPGVVCPALLKGQWWCCWLKGASCTAKWWCAHTREKLAGCEMTWCQRWSCNLGVHHLTAHDGTGIKSWVAQACYRYSKVDPRTESTSSAKWPNVRSLKCPENREKSVSCHLHAVCHLALGCWATCGNGWGRPLIISLTCTDKNAYTYTYELQPKFCIMERSIRDIFFFWNWAGAWKNDNTLFEQQ